AARTLAFETAKIKLRARLGERKVRRSKARDRVRPKHSPQKLRDRAFQVCHRDAAIDTQSFHLEEHRIVRRIGSVATKYTARRDHPYGHATTLHRVNLHGRSLRAQGETVDGVERVLPGARRVILGDVERVEVVEVGFDLAVVFDRISKRHKYIFQTFA